MKFVGADLHKHSITFCVVRLENSRTVTIERNRIACRDVERLCKWFAGLGQFEVVVEATLGYDWFAAIAEKYANRVVIAHAGKLRIIAESTRKTDKIDSFVLAEFLAHGMIPEAWRPTLRVRSHRSLVRRRHKLVSRITSIKNTVRAILTRYNADRKDLFTRLGRESIAGVKLLAEEAWIIDNLLEELDQATKHRESVETRLVRFAAQAPIAEKEMREILATFPGIGPVTVDVVLAELGDWRRFRSASAVVSYAGLDPGVRSSDGKRIGLRITKAGSRLLRWAMIQLAQRVKTKTARWSRIYSQLIKRVDKKKATCAIARRILTVLYAMLRDGKAYQLPAEPRRKRLAKSV